MKHGILRTGGGAAGGEAELRMNLAQELLRARASGPVVLLPLWWTNEITWFCGTEVVSSPGSEDGVDALGTCRGERQT
jgi:hypothetical protein